MAKAVGADYTVLVKSRDGQEVARQIEEVMGQKPEITIECSGAPPSIQTAIYVCSVLNIKFSFFFCLNLKYYTFGQDKQTINLTILRRPILTMIIEKKKVSKNRGI